MEKLIEDVTHYALNFRSAIEKSQNKLSQVTLKHFPHGSCGDVTTLLGTYLEEMGLGYFDYICGGRISDGHSHAWLEKERLIVDITADQFDDQKNKVIVSISSPWHEMNFVRDPIRHIAHLNVYIDNVGVLKEDYQTIKSFIQ